MDYISVSRMFCLQWRCGVFSILHYRGKSSGQKLQSSFTAVKQSEKKNTVSSRALMWWTLGQGGKLRDNSGWSSEKQQ